MVIYKSVCEPRINICDYLQWYYGPSKQSTQPKKVVHTQNSPGSNFRSDKFLRLPLSQ